MTTKGRINSFGTFLDTLRGDEPASKSSEFSGNQTISEGTNPSATRQMPTGEMQSSSVPSTGTPMVDIINHLYNNGPLTQSRLRAESGLEYKDFYSLLATLLGKDLIRLEVDEAKGEEVCFLTEKGRELAVLLA